MRLAFLGSPTAAVPSLRGLVAAGHDIVLVVSQPDRRRGRGGATAASPVKAAAVELGLAVTDRVSDVVGCGAELGVVVAFGRLIKPPVLAAVPMVNLHFSLLPRWRGAAPVERAILAGDTRTGVCLMALDEGLDTGPVHDCVEVEVGDDESADDLRARLAVVGTELLVSRLAAGLGEPRAQVGEPTYAAKLDPDELRIDWSRPAVEVHRLVRLGRAWTTFRSKRLRILRAHPLPPNPSHSAGDARPSVTGSLDGLVVACGEGSGLELLEVQPEGKGPQAAAAWRNGTRPADGEQLG
ncbi:MAG TPA: methionyl-tRNA formyltransferase [Acidimicrobiales bacterium]|nr:methionyl-tRNA formyltransferase [Acidimicrobiales bacterium]